MPQKPKSSNPEGTPGGVVDVIVEVRVSKGQPAASTFGMAAGLSATGFQLDTSYEPVPAGEPADKQLAAELDAAREETVFVKGSIAADKIDDLKAQDNVVDVWIDTPIEPFTSAAGGEDAFVQPAAAAGTCPIPPCDCDHGTSACSKGSMQDVAQYLGADQIWGAGYRGQGIVIGIVDGGITAQGRAINTADTSNSRWPNKLVPRVIGGWPTNDWGTTGVAWGWHGNMTSTDTMGMAPQAQIYDIRISGGQQGAISAALAGFHWAIARHRADGTPHILSNSWGIFQERWDRQYANNPNHPFTRKVVEAINEGILVLFAAGNCGESCSDGRCTRDGVNDTGPGRSIWGANGHPLVMTVGAANIRGRLIGYSSQGPAALDQHKPDFCSIAHFTGYFSCDTGTSAACPIGAGVVALLKQCNPGLTQQAIKNALKSTARNIGAAGWDQHSGSGIINAKAAFDQVCAQDTCQRYQDGARRYLERYRETQDRNHLCRYYQYTAAYYCCLFKQREELRYRCACYRYYAAYYQCLYQISQDRKHLCQYYAYLGAYYCCQYEATKDRRQQCNCYRYYASYYQCLYQTTQKREHLCRYYAYLAAYYCCLYQTTQDRKHQCACYRYYAAYYQCLYQTTQKREYLCRYYYYVGAYYCCMYQNTQTRSYLCACYRYYAAYYCCLYPITKNPNHKQLCERYRQAAQRCK